MQGNKIGTADSSGLKLSDYIGAMPAQDGRQIAEAGKATALIGEPPPAVYEKRRHRGVCLYSQTAIHRAKRDRHRRRVSLWNSFL